MTAILPHRRHPRNKVSDTPMKPGPSRPLVDGWINLLFELRLDRVGPFNFATRCPFFFPGFNASSVGPGCRVCHHVIKRPSVFRRQQLRRVSFNIITPSPSVTHPTAACHAASPSK